MSESEAELEARFARAQAAAAELVRASAPLAQKIRTSKEDKNFLASFHANSRLHFIGAWRERFDELFGGRPPPPPLPTPARGCSRVVFHCDLDCFFASVAVVGRPALEGVPLAVSWASGRGGGGGEISSANYLARAQGVRAGMWCPEARALCPRLVVVPYEFERYVSVGQQLYSALFELTPHVAPVSCDEAYCDVTELVGGGREPSALAEALRERILRATGCRISVGIAANRSLARLATARAKPDGWRSLLGVDGAELLGPLAVRELPGIGFDIAAKLDALGIRTCAQLAAAARPEASGALVRALGAKRAAHFGALARGADPRPWPVAGGVGAGAGAGGGRKSFGAQASWGVRFDSEEGMLAFVEQLCDAVSAKAAARGAAGKHVSVKVWEAKPPEQQRYGEKHSIGHGDCVMRSKAVTLKQALSGAKELRACAVQLVRALAVPPADVRGLGVQLGALAFGARPEPAASAAGAAGSGEPRRGAVSMGRSARVPDPSAATPERAGAPRAALDERVAGGKGEVHAVASDLAACRLPSTPPSQPPSQPPSRGGSQPRASPGSGGSRKRPGPLDRLWARQQQAQGSPPHLSSPPAAGGERRAAKRRLDVASPAALVLVAVSPGAGAQQGEVARAGGQLVAGVQPQPTWPSEEEEGARLIVPKFGGGGGGWSDSRDYFRQKRARQREELNQQDAGASAEHAQGERFLEGVVLWVDGHTDPPVDELRAMLVRHGGTFVPAGNFGKACQPLTHIVSSAVRMGGPMRMALAHGRQGSRKEIVTPAWLVDSVAARRKLDPLPYAVEGLLDPMQPTLSALLAQRGGRPQHSQLPGGEQAGARAPDGDGGGEGAAARGPGQSARDERQGGGGGEEESDVDGDDWAGCLSQAALPPIEQLDAAMYAQLHPRWQRLVRDGYAQRGVDLHRQLALADHEGEGQAGGAAQLSGGQGAPLAMPAAMSAQAAAMAMVAGGPTAPQGCAAGGSREGECGGSDAELAEASTLASLQLEHEMGFDEQQVRAALAATPAVRSVAQRVQAAAEWLLLPPHALSQQPPQQPQPNAGALAAGSARAQDVRAAGGAHSACASPSAQHPPSAAAQHGPEDGAPDAEFLRGLPEAIREELLRDWRRQQRQQAEANCARPRAPPASRTAERLVEDLADEVRALSAAGTCETQGGNALSEPPAELLSGLGGRMGAVARDLVAAADLEGLERLVRLCMRVLGPHGSWRPTLVGWLGLVDESVGTRFNGAHLALARQALEVLNEREPSDCSPLILGLAFHPRRG